MARFFIPASSESAHDIPLEVIDCLGRLNDEHTILLNPQFEREADIIVFTKHAAHVIEIKDKRGTIVVDQNDRWYVDGEPIVNVFAGREENPPTQAQNTARAFEDKLKQIYWRYGKKFNGTVAPYVLIPFASETSCSNLSQIREGWVWIITSLKDLLNAIAKRDERASIKRDFAFAPEDIELIVKTMRMKPVDEICGVRISGKDHTLREVDRTAHPTPYWPPSGGYLSRDTSNQKQIQPRRALTLVALLGILAFIGAVGLYILLAIVLPFRGIESARSNREIPSPTGRDILSSTLTSYPTIPVPSVVPSRTGISAPTKQPSPSPPGPEASPLTREWSASRDGLVLTIERVEIGTNSFRIWMRATNNTNKLLSLPLFGYFFVVDNLGNQYEADPFSSTFPEDIAPGATVSGFAKVNRPLDDEATSITVIFTHVFGSFSIDSISVENIPIP